MVLESPAESYARASEPARAGSRPARSGRRVRERPETLMNPEVFGGDRRFPELYGRGPAVPVTDGGPAIYAY